MRDIANFCCAIGLAGLVISIAGLLIAAFIRQNHAARYSVQVAALFAILLAPCFALMFGRWQVSWLHFPVAWQTSSVDSLINATPKRNDVNDDAEEYRMEIASGADADLDDVSNLKVTNQNSSAVDPSPQKQNRRHQEMRAMPAVEIAEAAEANHSAALANQKPSWSISQRTVYAAVGLWMLGVLLALIKLICAHWCARQIRRTLQPIESDNLAAALKQANRTVEGVTQSRITTSKIVYSPAVLGIWNPVIVMPIGLIERLTKSQLIDVLTHELAHVQRRDNFVILLQHVAGSVYWPIFTVHWLNRRLEQAREEVCDNFVLQHRDAINYGDTLLELAELVMLRRQPSATAGMFIRSGKLETRVNSLLRTERDIRTRIEPRYLAGLVCIFLVVSATFSSSSFVALAQNESPLAEAAPRESDDSPPSERDVGDPQFAGDYFGQVLDNEGNPLVGAKIYVKVNKPASPIGSVRAITNSKGYFDFIAPDMTYAAFDGLPARRETMLIATKAGFAADWIQVWGNDSEQGSHWNPYKSQKMQLHLALADVPFRGTLLAPDGTPLEGAKVRLSSINTPRAHDLDKFLSDWKRAGGLGGFLASGPDFERTLSIPEQLPGMQVEAFTDVAGQFTFKDLPRDRIIDLEISAPEIVDTKISAMVRQAPTIATYRGFNRELVDQVPDSFIYGSAFSLEMKPGLTIRAQVVDKQTKQPVAGMWAGKLSNIVNKFDENTYPYRTDFDGRFAIHGLSPEILEPRPDAKPDDSPPHYQMVVAATTPGLPYKTGWSFVTKAADGNGADDVIIEVERGIPFHLTLVDENGSPVDAKVTYLDVISANEVRDEVIYPVGVAAKNDAGSYSGFVEPGPGAVLISTSWRQLFQPASVDPKAFFAPGNTDWTDDEQTSAYGTTDTLLTHQGRYLGTLWRTNIIPQRDYSAIILVNPTAGSEPLELSATLQHFKTRTVYLFGPDGEQISGVQTYMNQGNASGLTDNIRGSSFELTNLSDDRDLEITFTKKVASDEPSELKALAIVRETGPAKIGSVSGKLDPPDNDPRSIAIQLFPPARITGRLVDVNGTPVDTATAYFNRVGANSYTSCKTDPDGRFECESIFPGHPYKLTIHPKNYQLQSDSQEMIVEPGELRELGTLVVNRDSMKSD